VEHVEFAASGHLCYHILSVNNKFYGTD